MTHGIKLSLAVFIACVAQSVAPLGVLAADAVEAAASGDLLGHLIGTISTHQGEKAVTGAAIDVSGQSPTGPWKRTATSSDGGFFSIDLPVCPTGAIDIVATKAGAAAKLVIPSGDIAQRLTPQPSVDENRLPLTGKWDFALDPPVELFTPSKTIAWSKINVPAHWEMEGFRTTTGRAVYRRSFTIPPSWQGKRIKFRAEAIYSQATVYVNSQRIGRHDGGATPFELDITDAAKPGAENVVTILVDEQSPAGIFDAMSYFAHFSMGGIWRPLEVFAVDPLHVSRLALATDFDAAYHDATLAVDVDVDNEQAAAVKGAKLELTVLDPAGHPLPLEGISATVSVGPWERQSVRMKARVPRPQQWNTEQPRLYTLQCRVGWDEQTEINTVGVRSQENQCAKAHQCASADIRFGFRKIDIAGRVYRVNGRPVKLLGTVSLDADPLLGRAITPAIARRDVKLMKEANINALRTTCFPPLETTLHEADRRGLYIEEEAPFCFVSVGYGPPEGRARNLTADLRLAPLAIGITSAMIERDRNHPSVSIWSNCNESQFGTVLQMAHAFTRRSDPTRPCSAGQSATLQLATVHNPTSLWRLQQTAAWPVPVLYDEGFAIFQGDGPQVHNLDLDPGLRDYWVVPHVETLRQLMGIEHQLGSMIFAWSDDIFLVPGRGRNEYGRFNWSRPHFADRVYRMPGRGIVGEPPWGIVDGWRRPRPEWWLTKKLFSPIQIKEQPLRPASPIEVEVSNRNAFINLDQYICRWKLAGDCSDFCVSKNGTVPFSPGNSETGLLRVNALPGRQGVLRIAPRKAPTPDDALTLEFFDAENKLVDGYRLAFKPHDVPRLPKSGKPATFREQPIRLDYGSTLQLLGKNSDLAFDRVVGSLLRGMAGRDQVLLSGPVLHVMRNESPAVTATWTFLGESHRIDGNVAVVEWKGKYDNGFAGQYNVRMDDAGNVEIQYRFTYSGADLTANEVGLELDVPLDCDRLSWDREAEWSYYPPDEIGRPRGVAVAHPKTPQTVPPGDRPFSLDDHPWGSNDFRSVKRNIYESCLSDAHGAGVRVLSDGSQHVRAAVGVDAIRLVVLDFYGGTNTGLSEWDSHYGRGRLIKNGEVVQGVVKLQLVSRDSTEIEFAGSRD